MSSVRVHFAVTGFMREASVKLRLKPVTYATAATVYHTFFEDNDPDQFDPYLIATTSIYLASKIGEDGAALRDVVNVCYRCTQRDKPPLDMGSTYTALRDSVAQCELLLLRALRFKISLHDPHKYLLHFIESLRQWLPPNSPLRAVGCTALSLLYDTYHSAALCLRHPPSHLALACLYLGLQCHGVVVPGSSADAAQSPTDFPLPAALPWWRALVSDADIHKIRAIISELIDVYDIESRHEQMPDS